MTSKRQSVQFPWADTRYLRSIYGTSKFQETRFREALPSPIYWTKPPGGRKILWNLKLVGDWLLNGGTTLQHQKLVEQYMASTRQSA